MSATAATDDAADVGEIPDDVEDYGLEPGEKLTPEPGSTDRIPLIVSS